MDFPPLKNDLFFRAVKGEKIPHAPVWAMRQAGLYLPEYKKVRATNDFFTICRTPELACEVTLQPMRQFNLDASIIFSDILVVPQALGMECIFVPGKGPVFPSPLKTCEDVDALKPIVVSEKLQYVFDAITLTRQKLEGQAPLFGFSGAPWTLMAYMFEGSGSKTFSKSKSFLYRHPEKSKEVLQLLTDTIVDYLVAQVQAGAQALMVFDSHAGQLSQHYFNTFSLPFITQIATKVKERLGEAAVPMGVFAKDAHYALEDLGETDFDIIGLDWTINPSDAVRRVGSKKCLQGNLDPCALYGDDSVIRAEVKRMMEGFGKTRLVANLGHGVHHEHLPESVNSFVEAVHEVSGEVYKEK